MLDFMCFKPYANSRFAFGTLTFWASVHSVKMVLRSHFEITVNRTANYYICFVVGVDYFVIVVEVSVYLTGIFDKFLLTFGISNCGFFKFTLWTSLACHVISSMLSKLPMYWTNNCHVSVSPFINSFRIVIFITMCFFTGSNKLFLCF